MGDSMGKVYRDVVNHEYSSQSIECGKDNSSEKKKDYEIAINQDGNLLLHLIRIVKFYNPKKTEDSLGDDKTTTKHKKSSSGDDEKNDKSKWSLDISNIHKNKKNDSDDSEYFFFVAISRINIDEDMKQEKDKKDDKKKRDYENGYLSKMQFKPLFDHNDKSVETIISVRPNDNFDSFKLNEKFEKFEYPPSTKRELKNWYTSKNTNCMERLLSCIYDKYFLVTQYKNDVQSLEVYNLEKMELETTAKRVENKDEFIEQIYSLEFIENDEKLLIIGKSLEGGLKFIIWDLYDTGKVESIKLDNFPSIENLDTRLARTSGNILQIDNDGNVSSILKKVENKLKEQKSENEVVVKKEELEYLIDKKHIIYYCDKKHKNFKPIVDEKEPWVLDEYDRQSYCIYQNKNGDETETLQLIVGRSTVQIWHQIQDDGEPFLEYIWSNRIPVKQESDETKLKVEDFKYGFKYGSNKGLHEGLHEKLDDFHLKVYWYERKEENENSKKDEHEIDDEDKDDSVMERKVKVINRKDIIEKYHIVRHACKALEHLNKRYKSKRLADNYVRVHKYEEIISYIKHIVWRFAKHEPENFKLLDVRYNIMKNLILSDCDQLINFILFGDDDNEDRNGKVCKFLTKGDLDFEGKDWIKENESLEPKNNMELAIYHCKDRELKDTLIIAYLLEYYSNHATDSAGWMCTVSKAIPFLFKYNYDDYARKLFFKECFANQDHFSAQDPKEIIPTEYRERRNHNIKFRAFRPIAKLKSDKDELYSRIMIKFKSFKNYIIKMYENFDNDLGKSPLALRVFPLPSFTISDIKKEDNYNWKIIIKNLFWFIFMPRLYKIGRNGRNKLSPFSRMILYENNDDIYDNPATEATKDSTYSGNATNISTNETFNIELKSDFDPTSRDNPFTSFSEAIIATYFWIGGNLVQRDQFDYWVGVYEKADTKGRQTLLRYQANHIADYEALQHIHFWKHEHDPKYIYYFGPIYGELKEKSTFTNRILNEGVKNYDEYSIWNW
ncbi:4600_t:CDS:10 [Rhizophagus irregularis]|nr:4600_t:CDS:10 [Rhizophagus irregularis]